MMRALQRTSEEVSAIHEQIVAKKIWWQSLRVDLIGEGVNAILTVKPCLALPLKLIGIKPRLMILSAPAVGPARYCVMRDGLAVRHWTNSLEEAVTILVNRF